MNNTVYAVLSSPDGSPHPRLEAVYDNEEAARKHESELGEYSFQNGVVAWSQFEAKVRSEYDPDDVVPQDRIASCSGGDDGA